MTVVVVEVVVVGVVGGAVCLVLVVLCGGGGAGWCWVVVHCGGELYSSRIVSPAYREGN